MTSTKKNLKQADFQIDSENLTNKRHRQNELGEVMTHTRLTKFGLELFTHQHWRSHFKHSRDSSKEMRGAHLYRHEDYQAALFSW